MRNRFVRTALVRETALRLASEALADLDFTPLTSTLPIV
jgi:hypothetical protein